MPCFLLARVLPTIILSKGNVGNRGAVRKLLIEVNIFTAIKLDLKTIQCCYLKKLSACFPVRQILPLQLTFSGPEPLRINADYGTKEI